MTWLVLLALVAPGPAHAAPPAPGARVRVTILERAPVDSMAGLAPGARASGRLLASRPHTIDLLRDDGDAPGDTLAIPRARIAAFESSRGRHGSAGRGALIGFLAGAVAGVAVGVYLDEVEDPVNTTVYGGRGVVPMALGVGGGLVGLGLGALIGGRIHRERWRTAEIPPPR